MSFRISLEDLSHQFRRTQKYLSKEINYIQDNLKREEEEQQQQQGEEGGGEEEKEQEEERKRRKRKERKEKREENFNNLINKLQFLINLIESSKIQEKHTIISLEARLKDTITSSSSFSSSSSSSHHNNIDMDFQTFNSKVLIMIGTTLLRRGLFPAVDSLILDSGPWLDYQLDVSIYKAAAEVVNQTKNGNLNEITNWINNHASKLRRLNSKLEFFVHQEQFLSLVYQGNSVEALRFAQENLAPLVIDQDNEVTGDTPEKSSNPNSIRSTPESTPIRNRAVSLGASPITPNRGSLATTTLSSTTIPGVTPPSNIIHSSSGSAIRNSPFSIPFSFPLTFFNVSTSVLHSRSSLNSHHQSTSVDNPPTRDRSMTIGCDTPSSINNTTINSNNGIGNNNNNNNNHHLTDSNDQRNSSTIYWNNHSPYPINPDEQQIYLKDIMCHLMSILAFGGGTQTNQKGQSAYSNVVPYIYQQEAMEIRLRFLIDLFHMEFRRVYRIPSICPLERLIEYGIFSLKTNCCGPKDLFTYRPFTREDNNNDDNDDDEDEKMERSPGSGGFINSNHGNVLVMTALRILQNGITRRSNCMDSKSSIIEQHQQHQQKEYHKSQKLINETHNCPVCTPPGQILGSQLPTPSRSNSRIKCRGSGKVMNHQNPPMVLPNGQVYSKKYIQEHSIKGNESMNQINDKNLMKDSSNPISPSSSPSSPTTPTTPPQKGIQMLLQFRDQVNNHKQQQFNNSNNSGVNNGIIRQYHSRIDTKQTKQQLQSQSQTKSQITNSSFICPNTNQTFHEKDAKQIYLV